MQLQTVVRWGGAVAYLGTLTDDTLLFSKILGNDTIVCFINWIDPTACLYTWCRWWSDLVCQSFISCHHMQLFLLMQTEQPKHSSSEPPLEPPLFMTTPSEAYRFLLQAWEQELYKYGDVLDSKQQREEGRHPSNVSCFHLWPPEGITPQVDEPQISFDHQQSARDFFLPLYPWPLKDPWLNSYSGRVLWGLLPIAMPEPFSFICQASLLLTLTGVPPLPRPAPVMHCISPQL